jgi:hypothetical protein
LPAPEGELTRAPPSQAVGRPKSLAAELRSRANRAGISVSLSAAQERTLMTPPPAIDPRLVERLERHRRNAQRAHYSYGPPLTLDQIKDTENNCQIKLPEEYRAFLQIVGDGAGQQELPDQYEFVALRQAIIRRYGGYPDENLLLAGFPDFPSYEYTKYYALHGPFPPNGSLILKMSDYQLREEGVCLALRGRERNCLWRFREREAYLPLVLNEPIKYYLENNIDILYDRKLSPRASFLEWREQDVEQWLLVLGDLPEGDALGEAAKAGDIGAMRAALASDPQADLNAALRFACASGQTLAASYLLDQGAYIHAWSNAPLAYAARREHAEIMELLLERGASLPSILQRILDENAAFMSSEIKSFLKERLQKLRGETTVAQRQGESNSAKNVLYQGIKPSGAFAQAGQALRRLFRPTPNP